MQDETNQTFSTHEEVTPKGYSEGKWTQSQHLLFLQGIKQHETNWGQIAHLVKTRSASQVRSHAQKYNNKVRNDKEKIQNQKIPTRKNGDMAKTRLMSQKTQAQEKEKEPPQSVPEQIAKENPSEISDTQKQPLGSNSDITPPKKSKKPESPKFKLHQESCSGSETHHSDSLEQSFFMERIYPHMLECPLESFSIFTLFDMDRYEEFRKREGEEENSGPERSRM